MTKYLKDLTREDIYGKKLPDTHFYANLSGGRFPVEKSKIKWVGDYGFLHTEIKSPNWFEGMMRIFGIFDKYMNEVFPCYYKINELIYLNQKYFATINDGFLTVYEITNKVEKEKEIKVTINDYTTYVASFEMRAKEVWKSSSFNYKMYPEKYNIYHGYGLDLSEVTHLSPNTQEENIFILDLITGILREMKVSEKSRNTKDLFKHNYSNNNGIQVKYEVNISDYYEMIKIEKSILKLEEDLNKFNNINEELEEILQNSQNKKNKDIESKNLINQELENKKQEIKNRLLARKLLSIFPFLNERLLMTLLFPFIVITNLLILPFNNIKYPYYFTKKKYKEAQLNYEDLEKQLIKYEKNIEESLEFVKTNSIKLETSKKQSQSILLRINELNQQLAKIKTIPSMQAEKQKTLIKK